MRLRTEGVGPVARLPASLFASMPETHCGWQGLTDDGDVACVHEVQILIPLRTLLASLDGRRCAAIAHTARMAIQRRPQRERVNARWKWREWTAHFCPLVAAHRASARTQSLCIGDNRVTEAVVLRRSVVIIIHSSNCALNRSVIAR